MISPSVDKITGLPRQARSQKTYEKLLSATAILLSEVGVEAISTNMICARADLSPPAFYRYFKDKYAIIEALAQRLIARRGEAIAAWVASNTQNGISGLQNVEALLRAQTALTREQPGAIWIFRAMRAIPRLTQVRLDYQNQATERLSEVYAKLIPNLEVSMIRVRLRIAVELTYSIQEMITEYEGDDLDQIFYEAGRMLGSLLYFPEHPMPKGVPGEPSAGAGVAA